LAPRVLIVEDVPLEAEALGRLLAGHGWVVRWARTVRGAWRGLSPRPDLVILDLGLPDGDGLGFLARLGERADPPPVLVLTGRTDMRSLEEAFRRGAWDYLTKPYDPRELLARLEAVWRRAQGMKVWQRWAGAFWTWLQAFLPILRQGSEALRRPARWDRGTVLAASWGKVPDVFWVRRFGVRVRGGELAAAPDGTLLALFSDPRAALEVAAALRGEGLRRGDPPGLGLAEGPVFRGPHGGPEWAFYAVMGPTAEAARRLAKLAPAGILLLEPALQAALPPSEASRVLPWTDAPAWLRPIPLRWPA
jgi:CheY-like chemotaxis protein